MRNKMILVIVLNILFLFTTTINAMILEVNNMSASISNYDNLKNILKEKANQILQDENSKTASIQYAISEGNKIIVSDAIGFSDKDKNIKADNNSIYGIGSISKLYTTVAVLQLVDEGKVDLDLAVTNYISDFKMKDQRYKKITVRMLLNHSAGFMGTTQGNVSFREINDMYGYDSFLHQLSEQNLKADPGEYSVYSNDSFTLAQILVERVSGMDFTQYIKENITGSLGLKNTKTPRDEFDRNKIAKAYDKYTGKVEPVESFMEIGMGGMYSTAEETCKFISDITNRNSKILSKNSVDAMGEKEYLKGVWPIDDNDNIWGFGLGWDCVKLFPFNRYGVKALSKSGETLDYKSYAVSIPEYDISVAVITSGGSFENNQYFAVSSLLELIKEKGIIKEELPKAKLDYQRSQYMPQYLKEYSGLYGSKNKYYDVKINSDGTLNYNDYGYDITLYHTYSGFFQRKDGSMGIRFVKEKNGETYMERRIHRAGDGLYEFAYCEYIGQKIENNFLSNEVKESWDKRKNNLYLTVSESYGSEFYQYGLGIWFGENVNGYINGSNKIIDKNNSKAILKIPGVIGSDIYDCEFVDKNGIEYVVNGGIVYMSQDGVNTLTSSIDKIIIEEDGYTKWFVVPSELDGKRIAADLGDKTNIIIYKANGETTHNFYFYNEKSAVLEAGDYVAVVGEKGAEIKVEIES